MAKDHHPEHEQLVAILCYFVAGIIWFFIDKDMNKSELVKFHTKQVINLWIINLAVSVAGSTILFVIPYMSFTLSVVNMFLLVLWVFGLVHAVNQQKKPIPVVGELAEKYLKY